MHVHSSFSSMKRHRLSFLSALLAVSAAATAASSAAVLVNENWEGWTNGVTPTSPWSTWTGSPSGTLGTVTVSDAQASPFGASTQSVFLNGISAGGPALAQTFAATSSALSVSFDFYLPASGAGVMPSMSLAGSNGTAQSSGITLNLTNSFLTGTMQIVNQGSAFNVGDIITPSATGKWFHIEITTAPISSAADSYSITVTPFGGAPVTVTDLAFRNNLVDVSKIEFSWNSTNGIGGMYIDNIVVATVPEPSAALLAASCGLAALFSRRSRARAA
jgi:hypothetical protein